MLTRHRTYLERVSGGSKTTRKPPTTRNDGRQSVVKGLERRSGSALHGFFPDAEGFRKVVDVHRVARERLVVFDFPGFAEVVGVFRAGVEKVVEHLSVLFVLRTGLEFASARGEVHRDVGSDFTSELLSSEGVNQTIADALVEEDLLRDELGFAFFGVFGRGQEQQVAVAVFGLWTFDTGDFFQAFAETFTELRVPATVEEGLD